MKYLSKRAYWPKRGKPIRYKPSLSKRGTLRDKRLDGPIAHAVDAQIKFWDNPELWLATYDQMLVESLTKEIVRSQ